jgi:hypothetical protein
MGGFPNHGGVGPFFGEKDRPLKEACEVDKAVRQIWKKTGKLRKQAKKNQKR